MNSHVWGDGMKLRNRLKSIRHKYEMNQEQFAEFLGILSATYNQYETQRRQPNLIVAIQIAEKLRCDLPDIFYI